MTTSGYVRWCSSWIRWFVSDAWRFVRILFRWLFFRWGVLLLRWMVRVGCCLFLSLCGLEICFIFLLIRGFWSLGWGSCLLPLVLVFRGFWLWEGLFAMWFVFWGRGLFFDLWFASRIFSYWTKEEVWVLLIISDWRFFLVVRFGYFSLCRELSWSKYCSYLGLGCSFFRGTVLATPIFFLGLLSVCKGLFCCSWLCTRWGVVRWCNLSLWRGCWWLPFASGRRGSSRCWGCQWELRKLFGFSRRYHLFTCCDTFYYDKSRFYII